MRVEIWSDLVCPWCYLGKRRLERALAAFPQAREGGVELVHRAFELDPSRPIGRTFDTVAALAQKYGLRARRPLRRVGRAAGGAPRAGAAARLRRGARPGAGRAGVAGSLRGPPRAPRA